MLYLYALPIVLSATLLTSAIWQQTFTGFTDLQRVERHVALIFIVWALGGWLIEERMGERATALYERCESEIQAQLDELDATVFGFLGENESWFRTLS